MESSGSSKEVKVEILPALPIKEGARKKTLSREKSELSANWAKAIHCASRRIPLLDASCVEVFVFLLYVILNIMCIHTGARTLDE